MLLVEVNLMHQRDCMTIAATPVERHTVMDTSDKLPVFHIPLMTPQYTHTHTHICVLSSAPSWSHSVPYFPSACRFSLRCIVFFVVVIWSNWIPSPPPLTALLGSPMLDITTPVHLFWLYNQNTRRHFFKQYNYWLFLFTFLLLHIIPGYLLLHTSRSPTHNALWRPFVWLMAAVPSRGNAHTYGQLSYPSCCVILTLLDLPNVMGTIWYIVHKAINNS